MKCTAHKFYNKYMLWPAGQPNRIVASERAHFNPDGASVLRHGEDAGFKSFPDHFRGRGARCEPKKNQQESARKHGRPPPNHDRITNTPSPQCQHGTPIARPGTTPSNNDPQLKPTDSSTGPLKAQDGASGRIFLQRQMQIACVRKSPRKSVPGPTAALPPGLRRLRHHRCE